MLTRVCTEEGKIGQEEENADFCSTFAYSITRLISRTCLAIVKRTMNTKIKHGLFHHAPVMDAIGLRAISIFNVMSDKAIRSAGPDDVMTC